MTSVALDPEGNVYVTGYFAGTINLGGDDLESHRNAGGVHTGDAFVASFTPRGEHRWSRSGGGSLWDDASAIAFDGSGSEPKVHITGTFQGTASFASNGTPLMSQEGSVDFFVASFDAADGSYLASRGWGGSSSEVTHDIAADLAGNVYVTGEFFGSQVDLGEPVRRSSAGGADAFVASYSRTYATSTCCARWVERFGSTGMDAGQAVVLDASGNVYVTGSFQGEVSLGGAALTSQGTDVVVASFNSSGAHRWSRRGGGEGGDIGYGIAVDAEGNVYVAGYFVETASFGGDPVESAGGADVFVASYSPIGEHRWSRRGGGPNHDLATGIAVSPGGQVYTVGYFDQVSDFGGGTLSSSGEAAFISAHGVADGAHRASFAIGGLNGRARAFSVAAGNGLVCVGGWFSGSVEVDEETLIAVGGQDGFIACFEP